MIEMKLLKPVNLIIAGPEDDLTPLVGRTSEVKKKRAGQCQNTLKAWNSASNKKKKKGRLVPEHHPQAWNSASTPPSKHETVPPKRKRLVGARTPPYSMEQCEQKRKAWNITI